MKKKGLTKERLTALILLGFSIFYTLYALRLKTGTIKNPGPGFMPILIGILLLICTVLYLLHVFSIKSRVKDAPDSQKNYLAVYGILVCTIAYPFLLPMLKFILSTLMVTFVMLIVLKPHRPVYNFAIAVGASISTFIVFGQILEIALPAGYIEEIFYRIGG